MTLPAREEAQQFLDKMTDGAMFHQAMKDASYDCLDARAGGVLMTREEWMATIDEATDQDAVFSVARHAAKRYLELCGQGDGAWGLVTEFLVDAALGGDDE